jgi:tetratricopeptide (TPR) repeat protein
MADIGRQLGVATILEGSVRRAGNKVRITADLINAKDGFNLWSGSYDRELNDIFAIQENIAQEVVAALKIKLLGADAGAASAARKQTTNLEAYDAFLLGQQRMARRNSASLTEASRAFQKAIDLDPNYALAYVGLSDATQLLNFYGTLPRSEMLAKAEPLVRKALQLDDRLGEAYASRGQLAGAKGETAAAESDFQKAIELAPNYSMAYMWYSQIEQSIDRKKALSLLQKALELDPLSPSVNVNLGKSLLQSGRADEAVERFRHAIEIEPGFIGGYLWMAIAYGDALNRPDEAVKFLRKAIEADPGNLGTRIRLAERLAKMGRWDDAVAECRTIIDRDSKYTPAYEEMSEIHAKQGHLAEAVRWQRKAVEHDADALDPQVGLFLRYLDLGDEAAALSLEQRVATKYPDGPTSRLLSENLHVFRGELDEAEKDARWIWEKSPDMIRDALWIFDMRAKRFAEARDRYRSSHSELFDESDPVITSDNLPNALNVAAAELKLDQKQHAEMILNKCEAYIASRDVRTRRASYAGPAVAIHALTGRRDEAMATLRRAIDDGFRKGWWSFPIDPTLDSIRDDPRFVAMMKEIHADVDRMRRELVN